MSNGGQSKQLNNGSSSIDTKVFFVKKCAWDIRAREITGKMMSTDQTNEGKME